MPLGQRLVTFSTTGIVALPAAALAGGSPAGGETVRQGRMRVSTPEYPCKAGRVVDEKFPADG